MHHLPTLLTTTMRTGFPELLKLQRKTIYLDVTPSPVTLTRDSEVYTFLVNSKLQNAPEEVLVGAFAYALAKLSPQEKNSFFSRKKVFTESEIEKKISDVGLINQYSAYRDYCLKKYSSQKPHDLVPDLIKDFNP